jgi:phosphoribosylaminoimidazole-succinocarboxamide synthase
MKKVILLLIISLFFTSDLLSAPLIKTNIDIIDSLISNYSKEITKQLNSREIKKAVLQVNNHSASELVYKHILANSNGIEFSFKKDSSAVLVNNIITKANVRYENYPNNNDSVYRIIEVDISTILSLESGKAESINPTPETYSELISRDDIKLIDSKEFTFTTSEVPQKKLTFYEKIAEPLIIVTTAILTVVLLFTIRSG